MRVAHHETTMAICVNYGFLVEYMENVKLSYPTKSVNP